MEKIKIFIADDNVAARSMLNRLLSEEEEFEVVGESGTGQGCIIMLDEANPDVVILEISIAGGMNIMDIVHEIRNVSPDVKIVLCADACSMDQLMPAAKMGASDFISKPYRKRIVCRTIRECMGQKTKG